MWLGLYAICFILEKTGVGTMVRGRRAEVSSTAKKKKQIGDGDGEGA